MRTTLPDNDAILCTLFHMGGNARVSEVSQKIYARKGLSSRVGKKLKSLQRKGLVHYWKEEKKAFVSLTKAGRNIVEYKLSLLLYGAGLSSTSSPA